MRKNNLIFNISMLANLISMPCQPYIHDLPTLYPCLANLYYPCLDNFISMPCQPYALPTLCPCLANLISMPCQPYIHVLPSLYPCLANIYIHALPTLYPCLANFIVAFLRQAVLLSFILFYFHCFFVAYQHTVSSPE